MDQGRPKSPNIDSATVSSFGDEWSRFCQDQLTPEELEERFNEYFYIFPWDQITSEAEGFDMGCGTGRWDAFVARKVKLLHCIDASQEALNVAQRRLHRVNNIRFHNVPSSVNVLSPSSQDFGFSLGVLHHIPNTLEAIKDCVQLLKPNAPFLAYIYYDFENRPFWFSLIWKISNYIRRIVFRLPPSIKSLVCDLLAIFIYYPLTRLSLALDWFGCNVESIPLSYYRNYSFYTMRTDARDRFGTPLEQRFSKAKIKSMFIEAGLESIVFSQNEPFWCVLGYKKNSDQSRSS